MEEKYIVIVFDKVVVPTQCLVYCVTANDIDDVIDVLTDTSEVPPHIDLSDDDNVLICGVHETQALCGKFNIGWLID